MTLPASGAISIYDLTAEFQPNLTPGAVATSLAIFRRQFVSIVPDITPNASIAFDSPPFSLSDYYSTRGGHVWDNRTVLTIGVSGTRRGVDVGVFGSLSSTTYLVWPSLVTTRSIQVVAWDSADSNLYFIISGIHANTDANFYGLRIGGEFLHTGTDFYRASASFSTPGGFSVWQWATSAPFGTSGTIELFPMSI